MHQFVQAYFLPKIDWIVSWKIYGYAFVFWIYACTNFAGKFLITRPFGTISWKTGLLLGTSSSLLIAAMAPLLAIPAVIVKLVVGEAATYSVLMAIPIAISVAVGATLIDIAALRIVLRQQVARRNKFVLFLTNLVIASLVLSVALARVFLYPVEQLASLTVFVV